MFLKMLGLHSHFDSFVWFRNFILSLWNKDVSRILPLSDCGVYDTPLVDESPRASLVRDIYAFLDQSVSSRILSLFLGLISERLWSDSLLFKLLNFSSPKC